MYYLVQMVFASIGSTKWLPNPGSGIRDWANARFSAYEFLPNELYAAKGAVDFWKLFFPGTSIQVVRYRYDNNVDGVVVYTEKGEVVKDRGFDLSTHTLHPGASYTDSLSVIPIANTGSMQSGRHRQPLPFTEEVSITCETGLLSGAWQMLRATAIAIQEQHERLADEGDQDRKLPLLFSYLTDFRQAHHYFLAGDTPTAYFLAWRVYLDVESVIGGKGEAMAAGYKAYAKHSACVEFES